MEPVPHAFASINRRNNEVQTHTAMWASASLFCPFTHTNVCGTGSDQIWKTCHKISVDIRILLQCTVQVVSGLMLITGFQRQWCTSSRLPILLTGRRLPSQLPSITVLTVRTKLETPDVISTNKAFVIEVSGPTKVIRLLITSFAFARGSSVKIQWTHGYYMTAILWLITPLTELWPVPCLSKKVGECAGGKKWSQTRTAKHYSAIITGRVPCSFCPLVTNCIPVKRLIRLSCHSIFLLLVSHHIMLSPF